MRIDPDISAVLFDNDDTLVGTWEAKWRQHHHIAREVYGKELTDDELREHWGKPLGKLVCLLYGTDNEQEALAHNRAYQHLFPKARFESTVPVLKRIYESNRMLGIITATTRFHLQLDLKNHGIPEEWLAYTQTADESPYHKPDPRVFEGTRGCLAAYGLGPAEVLYIGDSLLDMQAAIGYGFRFLGVQTGLVSAEQFRQAGAESISSLDELIV